MSEIKSNIYEQLAQQLAEGKNETSGLAIQAALNASLAENLKPISLILSGLFVLLSITHATTLPPETKRFMLPVAAITALIFLVFYFVLRSKAIPLKWAEPLAMGIVGLILVNSLLHLYLDGNPIQTTNIILVLLGGGLILISSVWMIVLVAICDLTWLLIAYIVPTPPFEGEWLHFGFALLFATVLSVITQRVRIQTSRRFQSLRLLDEKQQIRLAVALKSTEQTRAALATSIEVAKRITSILNRETLLNEVAELIKERYGHYFVGIFLLDDSGEYVIARAGSGKAGQSLSRQEFRLKIGEEGLIGWVAANGKPLKVDNVLEDDRYIPVDDIPDTRSELALPLMVGDELLGVLDLQSDKSSAFRSDDIVVLESLAGQVAIAIQNAMLYEVERSKRQLSQKLYNIAQALSSTLDKQEILDIILEQLIDIVPYDRVSLMLQENSDLVFSATRGFPVSSKPDQIRVHIKENDVFHQIYQTKRWLMVRDVSQREDWQHVEGLKPAQVWLGIPLIRLGDVIGMLSVTRTISVPYTEDEIKLAETFAGQAAIALENARLYESITRSNLELREQARELQEAYERLESLDRSKSNFINVAAHELRTPLTILRGYAQILSRDPVIKESDYYMQLVDGISSGANRLHEVVDSMLDIVKIDTQMIKLYVEDISISILLQGVVGNLQHVFEERDLTLVMEDMSQLPDIQGDHMELSKVFGHLVNNAIKYTPDGGKITLMGWPLEAGERDLPGGGVEIVVKDTGIGVDPRNQELIFTKFYHSGDVSLHSTSKTKFKGGGPGLGLSIVRGLVEAHGGKVWVESPGYSEVACLGSEFHVVLPFNPPREVIAQENK
ncbi:MAG: GAF domain-containing sensor histidine kinase [Anaerolineae bacterium]|nr:GAF domain-containing sensor histidine kinase [Anaerolineae bacterium]